MYVAEFTGFSDQKVWLQLCVSVSYVHIFNNLPMRGRILLFCFSKINSSLTVCSTLLASYSVS